MLNQPISGNPEHLMWVRVGVRRESEERRPCEPVQQTHSVFRLTLTYFDLITVCLDRTTHLCCLGNKSSKASVDKLRKYKNCGDLFLILPE